ncbi:MAG TPA: MBOAT family O-acyltransferase [Patescibacteria group bacterium]|nr:MBOAT family O-acyltransferase [Patescibacteria group bacterium]
MFYTLAHYRLARGAIGMLAAASLVFYAQWDIRFLPLLLISIVFNFLMGRAIEHNRCRYILTFGVVVNVGALVYYKYTAFLLSNINLLLQEFQVAPVTVPSILLPLGISFFSFTQIAYLVDIYRGESRNYNFRDYCLFVTFFPHLIAGPILYHKDIIPQFSRLRTFVFSRRNFSRGLLMFSLGLFKKVIIADSLIEWVTPVFALPGQVTWIEAWLGALAYTFQLYYDFSGYSDMAIGLGWMLNIRLPVNFNSPYRATSMIGLWNRWHITLVTFLNNYLFFPLGGSRHGFPKMLRNIMIIMIVAGVWHGANWNYALWGVMNGSFLVVNHCWRRWGRELPMGLAWALTFCCTVLGMMLTRAQSVSDAGQIFLAMAGLKGLVFPAAWQFWLQPLTAGLATFADWKVLDAGRLAMFLLIAGLVLSIHPLPNTNQLSRLFQPNWRWGLLAGSALAVSILKLNRVTEFLYFQF